MKKKRRIYFFLKYFFLAYSINLFGDNCSVSLGNFNLGAYNVYSDLNHCISSELNIICNLATSNEIGLTLSLSEGFSRNQLNRVMKNGNDELQYNIFIGPNPSSNNIWGNGNSHTKTIQKTLNTSKVNNNYEGMVQLTTCVFSNQDVSIGNYSDLLTVTIDY